MFSPILGSRCLATILVVINGAAVPAPARTLAPPISPAPGAAAMTQSPQPNRVLVSVCVARELVDVWSWQRPEAGSKMSDFKEAVAVYIESRRKIHVQYVVPVRAFADFNARSPLAIEEVAPGGACPPTAEEYTIPVEPPDDAPVADGGAGSRCNLLASDPGDPLAAGAGVANGQINLVEALPICEAAASAQPFTPRFAYLYGRVLEQAARYGEAATQYARAAQAGDANAAVGLAGLYYAGHGVERSLEQAARYCRQAADAGVPGAQYRMGFLYLWGQGVAENLTEAAAWFRKAGDAGFADAYGYLGRTYATARTPDFASAVGWFQYAADKGSPVGGLNLGYLYEVGHGVPQDDALAVEWFRWAADRNDPNAMRQLGMHLRAGKGVRWSEAEAMEWFAKAAQLGDNESKTLMAYGYMNGLGQGAGQGRQDYREAARLFGEAAAAGDAVAQLDLGLLYANGWGVNQDVPRARSLLAQAAGSGVPEVAAGARQLSALLTAQESAATGAPSGSGRGDSSWVGPAIAVGVAAIVGYALFGGSSSGYSSKSSGESASSYDSSVWQDPMTSDYGSFAFNCTVGGGSINVFGDCGTSAGIPISAPR